MAFEENKHPRAKDGKFTSKGNEGAGSGSKKATTPKPKGIDYDNIEYPKGTSKEYTMSVNKKFNDALPMLQKLGIKLEDFGGRPSKEGGYEDNTDEIMNKYVFNPFSEKYPTGIHNEEWNKEYQPIYDAIEAVTDKNYNDWWINEHSKKETPNQNNNSNYSNEYDQQILNNGKDYWVDTDEDEKVWNSLSNEDKYLLSVAGDKGENYDVWEEKYKNDPKAQARYNELIKKFNNTKDTSKEDEEKERKQAYKLFNLPF